LLSIASLTLCGVEDLRISPPSEDGGRPKVVGHYFAVPVFKDPAERGAEGLFRYDDIAPRVREVFGAWLDSAERLSAARSLYLTAAYGKAFLQLKLLALAQAAEALHRHQYEGHDLYMDPTEFEQKVLPLLKAAIPNGINSSHRQALRSRVTHGNEFSFRKRLTVLFKEHEAALLAAIPNPCGWINRIVDYRNNLTHHPVVEELPSVDRIELLQCIYVLRILVELCFLKSMSMSADEIRELSARSFRYQQIRQRFFTPGK
jgi:HEPN superfamily Apea-like protein